MFNFILLGVTFVVTAYVGEKAVSNFKAGSWMAGMAFSVAAIATVVMAKRMYDSSPSISNELAIAEAEMFGGYY